MLFKFKINFIYINSLNQIIIIYFLKPLKEDFFFKKKGFIFDFQKMDKNKCPKMEKIYRLTDKKY